MKKREATEMKIYEALGVKIFKKIVMGLAYLVIIPMTPKKTKEERIEYLYSVPTNYTIGKDRDLDSIKIFRSKLITNALIHIWAFSLALGSFLIDIKHPESNIRSLITTVLIGFGVNTYCVMLQRYNYIRIKDIIKRMQVREDKKKEVVKQEIIEKDLTLNEHEYTIINKRGKEKPVTFQELLNNSSLAELKALKESIIYFQMMKKDYFNENNELTGLKPNMKYPLPNSRSLKLELKPKEQVEGTIN